MAYLLDANVFIAAHALHYGLDFCPAFWDWLIVENEAGKVFSIEKVGDEVQAIEDDLSEWAADRGDGFFLRPDAAVFPALGEVSAWATEQQYEPAAVSRFLQVADYYLVARVRPSREPRNPCRFNYKDPDTKGLHRSRCQVHDLLRDVTARAGAIYKKSTS